MGAADPDPTGRPSSPAALLSGDHLVTDAYGALLTERQLAIGRLAVRGVETGDSARQLSTSENIVKTHLRKLYRKTGAANRHDRPRKLVAGAGSPMA